MPRRQQDRPVTQEKRARRAEPLGAWLRGLRASWDRLVRAARRRLDVADRSIDLRQHIEHLEALRLTGQELTTLSSVGLEEVLRRIANRAAELVKADVAVLMVRHPVLDCWVVEAASGEFFDLVREEMWLYEETPFSNQAFETGVPVVVEDLSLYGHLRVRFRDQYGAKSYMSVPLLGPHEPVGVMALLDRTERRAFTEWDIRLAQQFASYAAVAIENGRLFEATEVELRELRERLSVMQRKVADLTHEVKGPAGRVTEFASWIEADWGDRLNESARRYLRWIQKEGRDLTQLAEQTLDLARIVQAPATGIEAVDVAAVAGQLLEVRMAECRAKGVVVDVRGPLPRFACRRIHVKQILENLIDNAMKYMGDQPAPRIEIGAKEDDRGRPTLFIRDNGVGLDPSMAESIFRPFQRLGTIDAPGAGVGLSIVKAVVDHYGGEVRVDSTPGVGSTFYVRLPIPKDDGVAAHVPPRDPGLESVA